MQKIKTYPCLESTYNLYSLTEDESKVLGGNKYLIGDFDLAIQNMQPNILIQWVAESVKNTYGYNPLTQTIREADLEMRSLLLTGKLVRAQNLLKQVNEVLGDRDIDTFKKCENRSESSRGDCNHDPKDDTNKLKIKEARLLSLGEIYSLCSNFSLKCGESWWLGHPTYCFSGLSPYVRKDGTINEEGTTKSYDELGVRPALYLESSGLKIGDKFNVGKWDFTVILQDVALLNGIIGKHCFGHAHSLYDGSEVKKIVDSWFEREIKPFL